MARLWHGGAELNSTTDSVEVTTNSGTVAISSTTVRSGSYSWRANPSSSTGFYRQQISGVDQSKGGYLRAYIYIATLPGATIQILRFSATNNTQLCSIRLASNGTLGLFKGDNTQLGSSSSALNTGQWYRLELKNDASTNPGTLDARIDGVSFASGNNSARGQWGRILWGAITPNSTCDLLFDDVALNDDQGSNQTSWPGDEKLICLRPNAAGDSNQWKDTGGSAGTSNNYTLVDETPPNDATDYIQSTTLNDVDFYNVGASGIGGSDTVNVVTVHGRLTNDVADATIAAKLRIEKTGSGTVTEGSAIIPNTTTWQTDDATATFKPTLVTYADPDGSAWTQTTLDSMQIGAKITTDSTNKILISALWAYVGYTPAAVTNVTVTPTVQSVVASIIAAVIILGATISPTVQASTFSIQAPVIKTDQILAIAARTSVFSSQAPIVNTDQSLSLAVQQATFSIPAPQAIPETRTTPTVQQATFSTQAVSVVTDSNLSLSAQSATFNLQAPTVDAATHITVLPAVQSAALSIQAPLIISDSALPIAVQSGTFSLQAPSVVISIIATPSAQAVTFSIVPPRSGNSDFRCHQSNCSVCPILYSIAITQVRFQSFRQCCYGHADHPASDTNRPILRE